MAAEALAVLLRVVGPVQAAGLLAGHAALYAAADLAHEALDGRAYVLAELVGVEAARVARPARRPVLDEEALVGHGGDDLAGLDAVVAVAVDGLADGEAPALDLDVLEDGLPDLSEDVAR
ncbi:MAG TPA: hypothetical protein P5165_11650, partial [Spirochaetia bacterium]|nr:hypothetical protein [Spirochaetia bacterium]